MDDLTGVRISLECLSHRFRKTQKLVTKETNSILDRLEQLQRGGERTADMTLEELQELKRRLKDVQAEVVSSNEEETQAIAKAFARTQHLKHNHTDASEASNLAWHQRRSDTMSCDYLVRRGYFDAAHALAQEAGINDFVDIQVFEQAKLVASSIADHDVRLALLWCANHASKLRRIDSSLEFYLRQEEFIELLLNDKRAEALQFATDHMGPLANKRIHVESLMRLMGLLAFTTLQNAPEELSSLLSEDRWNKLVDIFWKEFKQVYSIPEVAPLHTFAQLGLLALKTNACTSESESRSRECPVCQADGKVIAQKLPNPYIGHTTLICRATGKVLDEHDPPMCLPNGQVLSSSYIREQEAMSIIGGAADSDGDGVGVVCPITGDTCDASLARPVYIA